MNIFDSYAPVENDNYKLTLTKKADRDALYKVYSDKKALPFFNSDNCDGDNFYYATKKEMAQAITFWDYSYKNRWFARLSVTDKETGDIIGTVEICRWESDYEFNNTCLLRIDLSSAYEKEETLYSIYSLILPKLPALIGGRAVITKVPSYAVERTKAARKAGFTKSGCFLIGKTGYPYDEYWIRNF